MKHLNRVIFSVFVLVMMISSMAINTFAAGCSGLTSEVVQYYQAYGYEIQASDIVGIEDKYEGSGNISAKYAITYVSDGGDVCNVYMNELPKDFGIWSTDIMINEGRVVVAGVNSDDESAWNLIYEKYRNIIIGVAGIGAITCVLAFVLAFIKLGASAGNPQERRKNLVMLLWTGAGAAGLGGVTIVFAFFWNII